MKNAMAILGFVFISFGLNGQSKAQYQTYMSETLALYDSVENLNDYQEIANRLDRIAAAESEEWLPSYYAALTHIYMSFVDGLENEQRDDYLDKAESYVDQAEEINGETSEIVLLRGYVFMAKVSVNPGLRGMTLSPKVSGLFAKALAMDPENPRANLMLGRWKYGSAQFFGSSTEEACSYMAKALELYQAQGEIKSIEPSWGENQALAMSNRCQGNK